MRLPGWYSWLALVVSLVASVALNVLVSVSMAERAVRAEQEGARRATCDIIRTQLGIYSAAPPSTSTGKEAARAWRSAYDLYRCAE